jgi:hypothetical protein
MKTKTQTTFILLERGTEDKALLLELEKIINTLKIGSTKELIKEYPLIHELRYNLKMEL